MSDYLEYEDLEYPDAVPEFIPSPANVLNWQAGDCFDFSIVLCSLLIGAGYDAYVVHGTAPKFITTKNESLMECPFSLEINDNEDRDDPNIDSDQKMMQTDVKNKLVPVDGFKVEEIETPVSVFDTNN